jgi:hypothetical protein
METSMILAKIYRVRCVTAREQSNITLVLSAVGRSKNGAKRLAYSWMTSARIVSMAQSRGRYGAQHSRIRVRAIAERRGSMGDTVEQLLYRAILAWSGHAKDEETALEAAA